MQVYYSIILPIECRANQFWIEAQTNEAQAHQAIVTIHLLDDRSKWTLHNSQRYDFE